jgi:hypothetical protein
MMACGGSQQEEQAACGKPAGFKECFGLRTYLDAN